MSAPTPSHSETKTNDAEKNIIVSVSSEDEAKFEKDTMRYVDLRIVPILSLVASFTILDRINIGYAYASGMGTDLALNEGSRLTLVICLFFIPDILLQLPASLLLRRFRVRNWLALTTVLCGVVQLGMSFVHTWQWLVVCRVLLGVFEATVFPAMVLIMTTWYKRHEVQKRFAANLVIQQVVGGLGPIFSYALTLLDGKGKLAGWRWIFIVEGLITSLLGVVMWFLIPDFPDKNDFLTTKQTALVLKRIEDDRGDAIPDPVTFQKFKQHLSDWTIWSGSTMFLCALMPGYFQGYFLPTIIKQMGWPGTQALLLSAAPPAASLIALFVAYLADRKKHRGAFIALSTLTCMTGISLLAFAEANSVRYSGAFLIAAGNSGCLSAILAYTSNNVVSQSKRTIQTGLLVTLGEIGGLLGTVVFRARDAPRYIPGLVTSLVSQGVLLLLLIGMTLHFFRINRLVKTGKRANPIEGQAGFYYTL